MGVSTKEIDRIVWAIVKASEYCYSEDDKEREKRINICFGALEPISAFESNISEIFSEIPYDNNLFIRSVISELSHSSIYDLDSVFFTRDFLSVFFDLSLNLVSFDCSNYEFIYYITTFVNQFYNHISYNYLTGFYHDEISKSDILDFCAYYCTFVYIRKSGAYNKMMGERFSRLLSIRVSQSEFKLLGEIKADYLKILGVNCACANSLVQAVEVSKDLLTEPGFAENPAIIATFCDCVILKLEMISNDTKLSDEDMENLVTALNKIVIACSCVPDYSTYHILYGRLLYLQAIYCVDDDIEKIKYLGDAQAIFSDAEGLLDFDSHDYFSRSNFISGIKLKCDLQIKMLELKINEVKEIHNKTKGAIDRIQLIENDVNKTESNIESIKDEVNKTCSNIRDSEKKIYLHIVELLGLFTAIIAFIITTVSNINSVQAIVTSMNLTVAKDVIPMICQNTIILTVLFGIVLVVVFGLLLISIRSEYKCGSNPKTYVKMFVIALIILFVVGFIAWFLSCLIT